MLLVGFRSINYSLALVTFLHVLFELMEASVYFDHLTSILDVKSFNSAYNWSNHALLLHKIEIMYHPKMNRKDKFNISKMLDMEHDIVWSIKNIWREDIGMKISHIYIIYQTSDHDRWCKGKYELSKKTEKHLMPTKLAVWIVKV